MGIFNLRWLCVAFLFIPSLVFAQAQPVIVDRQPINQSFRITPQTITTPTGLTASNSQFFNPNLTKYTNGLSQSFSGQIKVANDVAIPMKGRFLFSRASLLSGAGLAMRGASWVGLGAIGLEYVLDEMGWFIDPDTGAIWEGGESDYWDAINNSEYLNRPVYRPIVGTWSATSPTQACSFHRCARSGVNPDGYPEYFTGMGTRSHNGGFVSVYVDNENIGRINTEPCVNCNITCACPVGLNEGVPSEKNTFLYEPVDIPESEYCPSGTEWDGMGCLLGVNGTSVDEADIDAALDEYYVPEVEDFPALYPYISPSEVLIDPIPALALNPEIATVTNNETGDVVVTETITEYDFNILNNPSAQPNLDLQTNTRVDTYDNGQLVSSVTNTVVSPSVPSQNTPSPDESVPPSDLPAFCNWASIVCDWFGWTQEPIDEEPDLSGILIDEDFEQDYSIRFGSKTCPAPIDVYISLLDKDIEISFEWFCELAEMLYFMVMAAAYIFAAYISVGVVRNG